MTYAVMARAGETVVAVADTTITGLPGLASPASAFGERHVLSPDGWVQEAMLKILPIGTTGLFTYAGAVQPALQFHSVVASELRRGASTVAAITTAGHQVPFPAERPTEVLIATAEPTVMTYAWSSARPTDVEQDFALRHVGSAPAHLAAEVRRGVEYYLQAKPAGQHLLAYLLATCQSLGVHEYILPHRFGGTFVGAKLASDGFSWQDDTTYIVYPPENVPAVPSIVTVVVREDLASVMASHAGTREWIPLPAELDRLNQLDDWIARWDPSLHEIYFRLTCRTHVFISQSHSRVVVVLSDNSTAVTQYFRITVDGGILIEVDARLRSLLFDPLPSPDPSRTWWTVMCEA